MISSLFFFKKKWFFFLLFLFSYYLEAEEPFQDKLKIQEKREKNGVMEEEFQGEAQNSSNLQARNPEAKAGELQAEAQEFYERALVSYQEGSFEQAKSLFEQALVVEPEHPWILYNLGLAEFQLKNSSMALALWRKALFLSPLHPYVRKALDLHAKTVKKSQNQSSWMFFKNKILSYFSLNFILMTTWLLFFLSGCLIIRNFKFNKEENKEEEEDFKRAPSFLSVFIFFLFFLSFSLSGLKLFDVLHPRATVIVDSTSLRVGPKEEDNILLTLKGGTEVFLKKKEKDWFRVISEDGTAGWMISSDLFQTSGRFF